MSGFVDTVKSVRLPDGSYISVDFDHESRGGDFGDQPNAEEFYDLGGGYFVNVYRSGPPGREDDIEELYSSKAEPGSESDARAAAMDFMDSPRFQRLLGRATHKVDDALAKRDRASRAGPGLLSHAHHHRKQHHGGQCDKDCRAKRFLHQHKRGERHAPVTE